VRRNTLYVSPDVIPRKGIFFISGGAHKFAVRSGEGGTAVVRADVREASTLATAREILHAIFL